MNNHSTPATHDKIVRLIRTRFEEIVARRGDFSLRAYARLLGLNPTQLSETLCGKRPITRKIAARTFERLGLDPAEAAELLAGLPEKQVRKREKKAVEEREDARLLKYIQLSHDEFRVIGDWHHFAILSLFDTQGFKSDSKWIADRLGIPKAKVDISLKTLVRLGLIQKNAKGKLEATGQFFKTTQDVPSASIKKNHAQGLDLARDALFRTSAENREFTSVTLAMDPAKIPEAKEWIREFRARFLKFGKKGNAAEVYRMQVQFFPLTLDQEKVKGKKNDSV